MIDSAIGRIWCSIVTFESVWPEQFRREVQAGHLVDYGRDRAARHVRGDALDPGIAKDLGELAPDVRGRERRASRLWKTRASDE